ncbi:MAG: YjjW family glycine radical enzyme activase [Spirochaetales bacterium]|nr:YjjW family glycine radical enzyme activase [Spirochaetales bacterium]
MKTALINRIIPFSSIDGPGNRMVLFFQGCNYTCTYCHNPETINTCNSCGLCVPGCPVKALSISTENGSNPKVLWNPELCTDCGHCLSVCPRISSPKVREYSSGDLFARIEEAAPFIRGISCSGGEATLQIPFLTELFRLIKENTDLSCLIDCNGGVDLSEHPDFMELCDGVMMDLKAGTERDHKDLTGRPLAPVIRNIEYLKTTDKLTEIRSVLAPGLNNRSTVELGASLASSEIPYKLLPYRPQGVRAAGVKQHGRQSMTMDAMEELLVLAINLGAAGTRIITSDLS